jgi:hypothetical protein
MADPLLLCASGRERIRTARRARLHSRAGPRDNESRDRDTTVAVAERFQTFREFYPFYLAEHRHATCRRLHFVGSSLVIGAVLVAIVTGNAWWLAAAPVAGYGLAWIGHFFFEKNRPATFRYPFYSLLGDWAMFKDILTGKLAW